MSEQENYLRFEDEPEILIELIDEPADDRYRSGYRGDLSEKAAKRVHKSFDKTLDSLKAVTQKVIHKLQELKDSPDEVTLQMGVKINGEADAVLTKIGGETHLNLTLTWKKPAQGSPPAPGSEPTPPLA